MGVAIDVVDMGDPRLAQDVLGELREANCGSKVITLPRTDDGVGYMSRAVRRSVGPRNLWVLRLWGHGGCGFQNLSSGQDSYYGADWRGGLSTDNLDALEDTLAPLRPLFVNEKARVELRGCISGFSSFGTALMLKLAKILKVRVHASSDFQAGLRWISQVWEADPYGFTRRVQGYDVDGSTSPHYMRPTSFIY
jgi:hypothetical protein